MSGAPTPPDQWRLSRVRAVWAPVVAVLGLLLAAIFAQVFRATVPAVCTVLLAVLAMVLAVLDLRRLPPRGRGGAVAGACAIGAAAVALAAFPLQHAFADSDGGVSEGGTAAFCVAYGFSIAVLGASSWYSARSVRRAAV
jgi:hypothetical protein